MSGAGVEVVVFSHFRIRSATDLMKDAPSIEASISQEEDTRYGDTIGNRAG
jgi:hypothetical protein